MPTVLNTRSHCGPNGTEAGRFSPCERASAEEPMIAALISSVSMVSDATWNAQAWRPVRVVAVIQASWCCDQSNWSHALLQALRRKLAAVQGRRHGCHLLGHEHAIFRRAHLLGQGLQRLLAPGQRGQDIFRAEAPLLFRLVQPPAACTPAT